jgi:hypothetical protein
MTFDYSKLTAHDMLEFYLLAMRGNWGLNAGILAMVQKTGVDLGAIPAAETAQVIESFWRGFPMRVSELGIERLFKGENNAGQQD